jgi:hypothetical protein
MDSYREHPSDFELPGEASSAPPPEDVASAIGTDERRMHVRAYNHWASLLDGRDFPSIEDLEPESVQDFAGNSVLLDFTCGRDNPAMPYIGSAIRDECGLDDGMRTIADVPSRSLLSRLTDHYMQIIANRAPVGFEAEFENQRGETICYRGILMPFSSDGDTIDFIYGVINWKKGETAAQGQALAPEPALAEPPVAELATEPVDFAPEPVEPEPSNADMAQTEPEASEEEHLVWEDGPSAEPSDEAPAAEDSAPVTFSWEDQPLGADDEPPAVVLDESAGLADRLWAARETAEAVKLGEGRTRSALYKALSLAYDFALAAEANPDDYAELLEESGVKAQARAPMTPIVKLVFGIDYDKARLTEFAAALSYAQRQQIGHGAFQDFIEKQPGGLKALVAAERQARRPEPKPDSRGEAARTKLRHAKPIVLSEVEIDDEFALVLTRRGADGRHEAVAIVDDEALVARAIRKAA